MTQLTVIHTSGKRRIVEIERADPHHRLIVRWPNAGGQYIFDVVRNRMVRGSGWTFLEIHTARQVWLDMRREIETKIGIAHKSKVVT